MALVDTHNKRDHGTTRMALVIYFILVAACFVLSFWLIRENHTLQGTIFGGVAVILALAVLVARKGEPKATDIKKLKN